MSKSLENPILLQVSQTLWSQTSPVTDVLYCQESLMILSYNVATDPLACQHYPINCTVNTLRTNLQSTIKISQALEI